MTALVPSSARRRAAERGRRCRGRTESPPGHPFTKRRGPAPDGGPGEGRETRPLPRAILGSERRHRGPRRDLKPQPRVIEVPTRVVRLPVLRPPETINSPSLLFPSSPRSEAWGGSVRIWRPAGAAGEPGTPPPT
ncbi:hypothetical protein NDU88_005252 [Pleurodeles waltl]|uniref:Uncharacterized protein n=1 Tax=Pleurodeles waltl TaxID=8319 RepID=A0AAV7SL43_PLEWA|nr:hypothetical protein NDU88_005252 [Pleurodeles waltl]